MAHVTQSQMVLLTGITDGEVGYNWRKGCLIETPGATAATFGDQAARALKCSAVRA